MSSIATDSSSGNSINGQQFCADMANCCS